MDPSNSTASEKAILGIIMIVASVFLRSFGDALVKYVSAELTLWQIFVTRSPMAIPILLLLALGPLAAVRPKHPRWVFLRSILLVSM